MSERLLFCFPPLSLQSPKTPPNHIRKRVVDAVEHREDAQRVRESVIEVHQRAHQHTLREVTSQDLENHAHNIEHRRLHRVEADKVVELLVADDAEVDEEEDDEWRELARVVVGGEGP